MRRAWTYKEVVKALKAHDPNFYIDSVRGKGSHRMVVHSTNTKKHYPLPFHGDKTPIQRGRLTDLIRTFELPPEIFS